MRGSFVTSLSYARTGGWMLQHDRAGMGSVSILADKAKGKRRSMASQTSGQTAAEQGQRTPVGTIHVVDPNPLNWLFITWNTMEETVRTDERGHIVGAVMEDSRWVDDRTFEIDVRRDVR